MMQHTPEDFSSDCPPTRIMGTEAEYNFPEPLPTDLAIAQRLQKRLGLVSQNNFFENGAKIEKDCFCVEYSSPECDGPENAAKADIAGITVMQILRTPLTTREKRGKQFPVLRHAGSFDVKTGQLAGLGYHQTTLIPYPRNRVTRKRWEAVIATHLVTRIIWDGSGLVTDAGYLLSQKAPGIGRSVVNKLDGDRTTHGKKPLACLLQPGNSASDKIHTGWGILETRCADSHMSLSQSYMSLASISLVERLLEHNLINNRNIDKFVIENPVKSLHKINRNMGGGSLRLISGKCTSALGVQEQYADAISQMIEIVELPDDEQRAAERYIRICQKLRAFRNDSDLAILGPDIEWADKLYRIQLLLGENAVHDMLYQAVAFDLQWHRTDDRSIGLKVYDKRDPLHQDRQTHDAITSPPNTRAAARSKAIRNGDFSFAGWGEGCNRQGNPIVLANFWDPELPENAQTPHVAA